MKHNTAEVAKLQPDYLGFIFHEASPRYFTGKIPELPKKIKRVGVFVNEKIDIVIKRIEEYQLDVIQLHGQETPDYCKALQSICHSINKQESVSMNETTIEIIKVFSIKDEFDVSVLTPYEEVCDYFLFDTKGQLPGGNGYVFDWKTLGDYTSTKPFFLSGGIGLDTLDQLSAFMKTHASKHCYAVDVNSKFEIEPGLKHIEDLENFKKHLTFRT